MVLSLMRKHAKSWLIKFLIGIIAVVFIFYFGYSFRSKGGVKVAYVNGEHKKQGIGIPHPSKTDQPGSEKDWIGCY